MSGRATLRSRNAEARACAGLALTTLLVLACAGLVFVVHGHACEGDGCGLCLVAHLAQMASFVLAGLAQVLPRVIAACAVVAAVLVVWHACAVTMRMALVRVPCTAGTPVSCKVKLLM